MSIAVGFLTRQIPVDKDLDSFAGEISNSQTKATKKEDETNWMMVVLAVIPLVCALTYEWHNMSLELPSLPEIFEEVLTDVSEL